MSTPARTCPTCNRPLPEEPEPTVEILKDGKHERFHTPNYPERSDVFVRSYNEGMRGSQFRARLIERGESDAGVAAG